MTRNDYKLAMAIVEKAIESVNANAEKVTTVERYKAQFLLEQVIQLLQSRV